MSAIATRAPILKKRLGDVAIETAAYGEMLNRNGVEISLHPAGHVLGSAQVRVALGRRRLGRLRRLQGRGGRRRRPPSSRSRCHAFITESTFGLPIYRWRPQAEIFAAIEPGGARTPPPDAPASSTPMRSARRSGCWRTSIRRSGRSSATARSSRSTRSIARPASRLPPTHASPTSHRQGRVRARADRRAALGRRRAHGSSGSATIPTRWRAAGCRSGATAAGAGSTAALRSPTTPTGRACSPPSRRPAPSRVLVDARVRRRRSTRYLREKGARRAGARDGLRRGGRATPRTPRSRERGVKAFAALYRRLDSATSTRAKQAAMVEAFAAARADPTQWASAAWMVYFLAGGKPRQTVADPPALAPRGRRLRASRLALRGVLQQRRRSRRDAGAAAARRRRRRGGLARRLDARAAAAAARARRGGALRAARAWVAALPQDQRLAFFKLITGELRVGVSRLQVVKALAEVAGVEESRMAQRMIGYAQARRTPTADDFAGARRRRRPCGGRGARRRPALSVLSRAVVAAAARGHADDARAARRTGSSSGSSTASGPSSSERGDGWRLWSRGEELISDGYPDLEPLARALPAGVAIDGELVVLVPPAGEPRAGFARRARAVRQPAAAARPQGVSDKTLRELPVAFIAYDLLETDGPRSARRAAA